MVDRLLEGGNVDEEARIERLRQNRHNQTDARGCQQELMIASEAEDPAYELA